jgi:hypothetical protein
MVVQLEEETFAAKLQDLELAREILPLWTDWGVEDSGVLIHSLGVTFLTSIGQHLGYVAVSEVPVPQQGTFAHIGDNVRSDSIWFDRTSHAPVLIAEFERYSGSDEHKLKLENKVRSLLLAQHRCCTTSRSTNFLLLAYWTKGLASLPKHSELQKIVQHGFETRARQKVLGCNSRLIFLQFVMQKDQANLLHLTQIISRGAL